MSAATRSRWIICAVCSRRSVLPRWRRLSPAATSSSTHHPEGARNGDDTAQLDDGQKDCGQILVSSSVLRRSSLGRAAGVDRFGHYRARLEELAQEITA